MSIAVLKKKTLTNNPREAPISGIAGGSKFGFSLNGTLRGNYISKDTNLAPGAMTGHSQIIQNAPLGIYGHPSSVCTNDPTVVKTTVMNTKGMLAKRLRGIERIAPMAPERASDGCGMGEIINPPLEYITCNGYGCVGPLTQNWVKNPTIPNGNQSEYIERIVKISGKSNCSDYLDYNKSFNGIVGVLDLSGLHAINSIPQGCSTSGSLSNYDIKSLVESKSIMPFNSLCYRMNNSDKCNQFTPNNGIETFQQSKTVDKVWHISKPGINTIDYGTYISRRLKIKNDLPSNKPCNIPQPNPNLAVSCTKTPYNNYWNNNEIPTYQQTRRAIPPI